jgi:hypothetical protein
MPLRKITKLKLKKKKKKNKLNNNK